MHPGNPMRGRLRTLLLVSALLFVALAGRLIYLRSGVEALAASSGLEVEVFHQYPDAEEVYAAPLSGRVRVPNLLNASFHQAGQTAAGLGLLLEGKGAARGTVVRQEPKAGAVVTRGTSVRVWLEERP
ncbi:MAG TPA: PASTA domain-containing protein [Symbiobacteriaceae bacterium]|nr:PASTA domain-containing protein [Symbiobacteriaceae bacterium]